ncbi:MAG TPA: cytochrome c3 family protein [Candidatus Acidoferrales bacterium]|nr:cytochrome c3 family protein [Candidatus Acidoferrales bacterium]
MKSNHWRVLLPAALLALGPLLLANGVAFADEGCTTDKCHATLLKGKVVHPVAETCETCHESVSTPHPKKGQKTFKLTQEPPELCNTCHDAFGKKKTVHPPAAQGMCTTCHDPHSSKEEKLLTRPLKELCETCHADHADFKVLHGPVSTGDCTACHAPHESDTKALLVKEDDQLCFTCHADMQEAIKKKNVHPALQSGCTSCHNPHGSPFPRMLAEEGPKLCFVCHSDKADEIAKATVPHPALDSDKGCVSCHSPHASDNDKMLLGPQKEVCATCHTDIITSNMTVFHANDGKCSRCHNPHGSQNEHQLRGEFPTDIYVPYSEHEYELCFSCHKRELVQYPETSFATNFRDGERNLHYLHVNSKEKGRSCVLCHHLHGTAGPKLIAESVPFGKWNLPLKFAKTETGGSCAPGCHKPQAYDRNSPVKKGAKSG